MLSCLLPKNVVIIKKFSSPCCVREFVCYPYPIAGMRSLFSSPPLFIASCYQAVCVHYMKEEKNYGASDGSKLLGLRQSIFFWASLMRFCMRKNFALIMYSLYNSPTSQFHFIMFFRFVIIRF